MIDPLAIPHARAAQLVQAAPIVWVPVNPVEYHGPHLPLHTDHLQTTAWVSALHRAMQLQGEPLITRDLEIGVDPTPGPGSRAASYREVRRSTIRACRALGELGAKAIGIVTFHGAPLHNLALADAVRWCVRHEIRAVAPFQEVTRAMGGPHPLLDEVAALLPEPVRAEIRASLPYDFHAGLLETSLMLHWHPDAVSSALPSVPPCPEIRPQPLLDFLHRRVRGRLAEELALAAHGVAWHRLKPFPGYTGHPALATGEIGGLFARAVVDGVVPAIRGALDGSAAPEPPFRWAGPLTLWGRLGP